MSLGEIREGIANYRIHEAEELINQLPSEDKLEGEILRTKILLLKGSDNYYNALKHLKQCRIKAASEKNAALEIHGRTTYYSAILTRHLNLPSRKGLGKHFEEFANTVEGKKDEIPQHIYIDAMTIFGFYLAELNGQRYEAMKLNKRLLNMASTDNMSINLSSPLLHNIGRNYYYLGEIDKALESYKMVLEHGPSPWTNYHIAYIYMDLGASKKAINHLMIAYKHFKNFNLNEYTWKVAHILSLVYLDIYDFDSFLEYRERSHEGVKRSFLINKEVETNSLSVGLLYLKRGQFETAEEILTKFYRFQRKHGIIIEQTLYLYYVIRCKILLSKIDEAKKFYRELVDLKSQLAFSSKYVDLYLIFLNALLHKETNTFESLSLAKEGFSNILNRQMIWYEITYLSLFNLIDILMVEYDLNNSDQIFDEIERLFSENEMKLKEQEIDPYLSELMYIYAVWNVKLRNFDKAFQLLDRAFEIAESIGAVVLGSKIMDFYDRLMSDLYTQSTDNSLKNDYSNMNDSDIFPLSRIKERDIDQIDEPISLYVTQNDEEIIFHKNFGASESVSENYSFFTNEIRPTLGQTTFLRDDTSIIRRNIDGHKLFFLKQTKFQVLYIFRGSTLKAALKFSLLKEFLKSQEIERLVSDEKTFSNYLNELFLPELHQAFLQDLPSRRLISDFEYIVHPIRLAIMKMLSFHYQLSRVSLLKKLAIPPSTLDHNLSRLIEIGFVEQDYLFIDEKQRKIIVLTSTGNMIYNRFVATINS